MLLILLLLMSLKCRECNIENDDRGDHSYYELMIHYNNLHKKLVDRFKICMQKLYSGYHFRVQCKDNCACAIST